MEPPEPIEHFGIPGEWMNELLKYCISIRPINGPGLLANQGPDGIMLEAVVRGGKGANGTHPFQGVLLSNAEGLHTFRVVYGTLNNFNPVGISAGDSPIFTFTSRLTNGVAWIKVIVSDPDGVFEAKDVTIESGETLPEDGQQPNAVNPNLIDHLLYRQLFNWVTTPEGGIRIAQDVTTSIWFELCGGAVATWGAA